MVHNIFFLCVLKSHFYILHFLSLCKSISIYGIYFAIFSSISLCWVFPEVRINFMGYFCRLGEIMSSLRISFIHWSSIYELCKDSPSASLQVCRWHLFWEFHSPRPRPKWRFLNVYILEFPEINESIQCTKTLHWSFAVRSKTKLFLCLKIFFFDINFRLNFKDYHRTRTKFLFFKKIIVKSCLIYSVVMSIFSEMNHFDPFPPH